MGFSGLCGAVILAHVLSRDFIKSYLMFYCRRVH